MRQEQHSAKIIDTFVFSGILETSCVLQDLRHRSMQLRAVQKRKKGSAPSDGDTIICWEMRGI